MSDGNPGNGWSKAELYVMEKLDRLEKGQQELLMSVARLDKNLAVLSTEVKLKGGIWGALAGLLAALGLKLWK
jgi:hypothetical protein